MSKLRNFSVLMLVIFVFCGCATSKSEWREAKKTNTIDAYDKYLAKYKNGDYIKLAKSMRSILVEKRDYKVAVNSESIDLLEAFIENFPLSKHKEEIEEKLGRLRDKIGFEKANQMGNVEAYEKYLNDFPEGDYRQSAQAEKERLEMIVLDKDWQISLDLNTFDSYERFLRKHPRSKYSAKAGEKLESLGKNADLERIRKDIESIVEKDKSKKDGIENVFVFTLQSTEEKAHFVFKDFDGLYYKVDNKGKNVYPSGLDVPYLKFAKPREGTVFFVPFDDLFEFRVRQSIFSLFDDIFSAFKVVEKSNLVFIHPAGVDFTKKTNKINDGFYTSSMMLLYFISRDQALEQLKGKDLEKIIFAIRSLGIFGDFRAVEPLKVFRNNPNKNIRETAQKALSQIEETVYAYAKEKGTVAAFNKYLNLFPDGKREQSIKRQLIGAAFEEAKKKSTIKALQSFLHNYPDSEYSNSARSLIAKLEKEQAEKEAWEKAKTVNKYKGYAQYLADYPKGNYAEQARKELPNVSKLTQLQVKALERHKPDTAEERAELLERLLFTGASCLDENAKWTDRDLGREVYNILKRYDSGLLASAMRSVVLKNVDRLRILFLVVKIGAPGTQKPLVDLLLEYGDKSMAEDYLNCGSKDLYEGGRQWASRHGYYIQSGFGSHRVGWGRF